MAKNILYIMKGYPRLSETFIAQEIALLESLGFIITIVSLRKPLDKQSHPLHQKIKAQIIYLPEYLKDEPLRLIKAVCAMFKHHNIKKCLWSWCKNLPQNISANHFRRLGQALVLAHEFPEKIDHIHVHFLHTPASVGQYVATLKNLAWTCSAHAKDIWTISMHEKKEKLKDMLWLTTCTEYGARHLQSLSSRPKSVFLDYHGLDFEQFGTPKKIKNAHEENTITILSVGRAVEKKGYDVLLRALSKMKNLQRWKFIHIGSGEMLNQLKDMASNLGLENHVEWLGAKSQPEVLTLYRQSDIFVLPCRICKNGDRDGLPNVLMEAMSQGLPCISSNLPSIAEILIHDKTGILVETEDSQALSEALISLILDHDKRLAIGKCGQIHVLENFDCHKLVKNLAERFEAL